MALIKQDKFPFIAEEFFDGDRIKPGSRQATIGRKSAFAKQTDKFLATLSQGFGAAASGADGRNPNTSINDSMTSPRAGGGSIGLNASGKPINYYELRCNELQDEIDELHRLINEGHGHDSIVASYIEQVKRKDQLLLQRDKKLDDLQTKNMLADKERASLQAQLGVGTAAAGLITGEPANETEAELQRMQLQN